MPHKTPHFFLFAGAIALLSSRNASAQLMEGRPLPQNDALVQQIEQSYGPRVRHLCRTELHVMRLVTQPTKAQYEKIAADNQAEMKELFRKLAQSMNGNGTQTVDPRALIGETIAKSVQKTLSPGQSEQYRKEVEMRTAARKQLVVLNLVAMLDKALLLRPDQREKLREALTANWNESWNQTQLMMYSQYCPMLPDAKITPILSEAQATVYRGIPKTHIRFGLDLNFVVALELEDEVWDEDTPARGPKRADDKAAPKAPAALKPNRKP